MGPRAYDRAALDLDTVNAALDLYDQTHPQAADVIRMG